MNTRQISQMVLLGSLVLGAFILFTPILWTFTTSFKTAPEITKVPIPLLPNSFTNLNNYIEVIKRLEFIQLIFNSLVLCAVIIVITLLFVPLAGYGFAKFNFRGKELLFFLIVGVLMVPFQSVAVPLYLWMDQLNLIDTFPGLFFPLMISAFGVLFMRESISTLPTSYIEAARIDGCPELKIYFLIILPMLKPALVTLVIIKFLLTWNEFFWPLLIINTQSKAVVTLGLSFLANMYFREYHLITAAAIMSLVPLFIMFFFLNKWMVSALAGTGLKG